MTVCPFQKPVNKLLSLGLLVGLVFGSADQARAQIVPLPTFNVEMDQTSISGLSSGGYMAVQFSVAFSALVRGVGVIAGGPYYCAQGDTGKATALCTCTSLFCGFYPESIDVAALIRTTDENARRGRIDPTSNLAQQRIWLFSGKSDSIVPQRVMDALDAYFAHYVEKSRISYNRDIDAQHAMPTDSYGNPCDDLGDPYINNCAYDAAGELLKTIYGTLNPRNDGALGGEFVHFDQREFLANPTSHGMDDSGWLYVPAACRQNACRLHVALHGCRQYPSYRYFQFGAGFVTFGTTFVRNAGYNKWADTNRIIVLYPQATAVPDEGNLEGCWDWWGYDDPDYAAKSGRQMAALRRMVTRLARASGSEP